MFQKRGSRIQLFLSRCNFFPKNSKGQLTIFIVVGVLIVSGVALFFLYNSNILPEIGGRTETNPNLFLRTCIEDKMKEGLNLISLNGGKLNNPASIRFKFADEDQYHNISYLCYTPLNYVPCINQNPLLIKSVEEEIKDYIKTDFEDCFDGMISNFDKQGFETSTEGLKGFEVKMHPKKIAIETDSEVTLTKTGETTTQKNLGMEMPSRIYEILNTVQEISNQEAEFCNFDSNGFMIVYPEFNIKKTNEGGKGNIYAVGHRETGEKFRFATRSCVMLPGLLPDE